MFGEANLGKLSCSDLFEAASLLGHLESENQKETSRSLLKQLSSCSRFFTFIFIVEKCPFSSKHNTRQITPSREAGSGGMDLEVGGLPWGISVCSSQNTGRKPLAVAVHTFTLSARKHICRGGSHSASARWSRSQPVQLNLSASVRGGPLSASLQSKCLIARSGHRDRKPAAPALVCPSSFFQVVPVYTADLLGLILPHVFCNLQHSRHLC